MRQMNLSTKLIGAFLIVASITMVVGLLVWKQVSDSSEITKRANLSESISRQLLQREIDHLNWVVKVGEFQRNENLTELGVEKDEHKCGFGKWYYSEDRKKAQEVMPEIASSLGQLEEPHRKLHQSAQALEAILQKGKEHRAGALSMFQNDTIARLKEIQKILGEIRPKVREHTEMLAVQSEAQTKMAKFMSILGAVLSPVVAFAIGLLLNMVISRPIKQAIAGLGEGSGQMAAASSQVSSASQELAEGASEQAASIEEVSSSLEEMASMTGQNADSARQANQLMAGTAETVSLASKTMVKLTVSMGEISRASEETSKIIKTIDEIAFQTNLLALNAAVEAARAGEAGAGFAVVADEVRNLAMRAAEAAKNTANLIEGTVKKVKEGSELVDQTEAEFREVAHSVGKSGELVGEISAASHEQAQGIEQINKAVGEMDKVVQRTAANAEEAAAASEEMNAQACQMNEFVGALRELVDGSKGNGAARGTATRGNKTSENKTTGNPPRIFSGHRNKANGHSTKGNGKVLNQFKKGHTKSAQVIPFDDAEVSDF